MKKIRNIPLLVSVMALALGSIGVVAAGSQTVSNSFRISTHDVVPLYSYEVKEHWLPGEEIRHETALYNCGDMDAVLRVKFDEEWEKADGTVLANTYEEDGSIKEMTEKIWGAAGITESALWQDGGDGYYYYTKVLQAGEITDDLLCKIRLTEERICDDEGNFYTGAKHSLEVCVDAMPAVTAGSDRAVRKIFGEHVAVEISDHGEVMWTFSP